jgi:hypothetical protein
MMHYLYSCGNSCLSVIIHNLPIWYQNPCEPSQKNSERPRSELSSAAVSSNSEVLDRLWRNSAVLLFSLILKFWTDCGGGRRYRTWKRKPAIYHIRSVSARLVESLNDVGEFGCTHRGWGSTVALTLDLLPMGVALGHISFHSSCLQNLRCCVFSVSMVIIN